MKTWLKNLVFPILFLALTACDSVLYYPAHDQKYDPERFGVTAEDVWFQNEEKAQLHGWYFSRPDLTRPPRAVFVFFHGNGGNISYHFPALVWTLPHGFDFFIFDYEGYGESPGEPTPKGTVLDGMAAMRYVHARNPNVPIIAFAQSLGGAVGLRTAIELKGEIPLALVIADSTFPSYKEEARKLANKLGMGDILAFLLPSDEWAPGERISEISPTPILIIHGTEDTTVDYSFGLQLFQYAKEPKEFWWVPGGKHIDAFSKHGTLYQNALLDKLNGMHL